MIFDTHDKDDLAECMEWWNVTMEIPVECTIKKIIHKPRLTKSSLS